MCNNNKLIKNSTKNIEIDVIALKTLLHILGIKTILNDTKI